MDLRPIHSVVPNLTDVEIRQVMRVINTQPEDHRDDLRSALGFDGVPVVANRNVNGTVSTRKHRATK